MRIREPIILLLILSISNFIIFEAEADSEPNNTFSEVEEIKDGTHTGSLSFDDGTDVDVYKIFLHRNERVNISIGMIEDGYLVIKTYNNREEEIEDKKITLTKKGQHDTILIKNTDEATEIYLQISGNSAYRLKIDSSMNSIDGFISDYLDSTLIFVAIVIPILVTAIFVVYFFIKTIKLSISHGFETKECEKGDKIGLADRRSRPDCMEILTDDNGVERMMKYEEAKVFKSKQDKYTFRVKKLDDYYGVKEKNENQLEDIEKNLVIGTGNIDSEE